MAEKKKSFVEDQSPSIVDQKLAMEKAKQVPKSSQGESLPDGLTSFRFDHTSNYRSESINPSFKTTLNNMHSVSPAEFQTETLGHMTDPTPPYENSFDPPYYNMPLKEMGFETRRVLGEYLDVEIAVVKNWKSLADEMGFTFRQIRQIESLPKKTEVLLDQFNSQKPGTNLRYFCEIIKKIERHDIITDLTPHFEKDYERYKRPQLSGPPPGSTMPYNPQTHMPASYYPHPSHFMPFTTQPHMPAYYPPPCFSPQQQPQPPPTLQTNEVSSTEPFTFPPSEPDEKYDGLVLYHKADKDFILKELLPRLEEKEQLHLFIPERDLEVGVQAYNTRLDFMIKNCRKLVVILSDEFLQGEQWGLNLAVSIDPAARKQRIIPVIYKDITKTNILSGINACDRTRVLDDEWFWQNLIKSLRTKKN